MNTPDYRIGADDDYADFDWVRAVGRLDKKTCEALVNEIDEKAGKAVRIKQTMKGFTPIVSLMKKKASLGWFETRQEAIDAAGYLMSNLKDAILDRGAEVKSGVLRGHYKWRTHVAKNGKEFGHVFPKFMYADPLIVMIALEDLWATVQGEIPMNTEVRDKIIAHRRIRPVRSRGGRGPMAIGAIG